MTSESLHDFLKRSATPMTPEKRELWLVKRAELIAGCRRTYPAAESDIDALALTVSNMEHHMSGVRESDRLNAMQAQKIAILEGKLESRRAEAAL